MAAAAATARGERRRRTALPEPGEDVLYVEAVNENLECSICTELFSEVRSRRLCETRPSV